jgi:hypothetical protein
MKHNIKYYRDVGSFVDIAYCDICKSEDQAVLYGQPCSIKSVDNNVSSENDDIKVDKDHK